MRKVVILTFLLVLSCGKPSMQPVNINDTSEFIREPQASAATDTPIEPEIVPVADTDTAVVSPQTAQQAFNEYASNHSLNYSFVKAEFLKKQGGIDYYRVKYSFGSGNRYVIVDGSGKVYDEYYMP
jgi:hypothetical protein